MDESADIETIRVKSQVFDVDFHPSHNIVAVGLISGKVICYQYSPEGNKAVLESHHHRDACRAARFSADGTLLFTASSDRSVRAMNTEGSMTWKRTKAHKAPINCLKLLGEHALATGDDNGTVKVWDTRQEKAVHTITTNTDFISEIQSQDNDLLITSGDGSLAVAHWRTGQVKGQSVCLDDELLSAVVVKNGQKVVCGSQNGILNIFNYGQWGDISDRYPGHPSSVDTLAVIDEDTICTGASDGMIRIISILPNKLLGLVGEHGEYPIERIVLSGDRKYLASASHDKTVKFWDVSFLYEGDEEEEEEGEGGGLDTAGGMDMGMDMDDSEAPMGSASGMLGQGPSASLSVDSADGTAPHPMSMGMGMGMAEEEQGKKKKKKRRGKGKGKDGGGQGGGGGPSGFFDAM